MKNCRTIGDVRDVAAKFRQDLGIAREFRRDCARSPALGNSDDDIVFEEISLAETDPWRVLHLVGQAYQHVAGKEYKHKADKACLGLPRKIHGPWGKPIPNRQSWETWKPPRDLESEKGTRYASPLHIHISKEKDRHIVRLLAYHPPYICLKNDKDAEHNNCEEFLNEFVRRLKERLPLQQPRQQLDRPVVPIQRREIGAPKRPPTKPEQLVPRQVVKVRLLRRDKKQRWVVEAVQTKQQGKIKNTDRCPGNWKAGDEVHVVFERTENNLLWFKYQP